MIKKYMRFLIKNYLFVLICTVYFIAYWHSASKLEIESIRFPIFISTIVAVLLAWNYVNSVREFRMTYNSADDEQTEKKKYDMTFGLSAQKVVVILATVAYGVLITIIGFFVSSFFYIGGVAWYLGIRKPVRAISFALLFTMFLYAIFRVWLQLRIPVGIIGLF